MLWRFSFASASNVDAILSRETPPSVEELMDEQEILNECKAQNNKLVTYLSKDESVKTLLQWVVSGLDKLDEQAVLADSACFGETSHQDSAEASPVDDAFLSSIQDISLERQSSNDSNPSRYPQIATEILTSELWTISETVMSHKDTLLKPFWDTVLPDVPSPTYDSERERARDEFWTDDDEERDRKREIIRGMWTRVNGALMHKRTHEMIRFIQSLPNIVRRLTDQISSPAIQDMLIRIVSAEEAGVSGVVEWLAGEDLVPLLLSHLSPGHSTSVHSITSELIKSIITLCAPAPFNPNTASSGTRDNRMIRELVSEQSINTMIGFMLDPIQLTDAEWVGTGATSDPFIVHPLPSVASATSSLSHICNILVEIIRRNNSDFSEPHLFHTLRHKLMMIQGQQPPDAREAMEEALAQMGSKMGIVHLGHLISTLSDRFHDLHQLLLRPRSRGQGLLLERFRIVELYAELLHSSNMSILNRRSGPTYTQEGILEGGLTGLEALGQAVEGDADEVDSEEQPPGDRLKQMYLDHSVLPDVVDLFFRYPNNDFMHHVVYDLLQQILNGRLTGTNRDLIIEMLCKAKLVERILDAQRLNDRRQPKQPRLPYMGHVILVAEELVKFFARCPSDLAEIVTSSFLASEWEAFVEGTLQETKARDAQPLAGGKPTGAPPPAEDTSSDEEERHDFGEPLTRTVAQDGSRFEDEEFYQGPRHVDSSDDDDDDADWMRPATRDSDDDDFGVSICVIMLMWAYSAADDGWGNFADDTDNPFGDDNFAPSVGQPLTPHDWASEFDREFGNEEASAPAQSLAQATDADHPLGPGVTDAHVTVSGMVEKKTGDETIVVPADEIVRSI